MDCSTPGLPVLHHLPDVNSNPAFYTGNTGESDHRLSLLCGTWESYQEKFNDSFSIFKISDIGHSFSQFCLSEAVWNKVSYRISINIEFVSQSNSKMQNWPGVRCPQDSPNFPLLLSFLLHLSCWPVTTKTQRARESCRVVWPGQAPRAKGALESRSAGANSTRI